MTVEISLVLCIALLFSAFTLSHLYWRPIWLYQWRLSRSVKGLGLFALFLQIIYGLIDVSLGVTFEQLGYAWAESLRDILTYNSLAAIALITDLITSAIAYYLFYLAAFQALSKYQTSDQTLPKRAFNFMLISISITILIKVVNLFAWQVENSTGYITEFLVAYTILTAFTLFRLVNASAGLLKSGKAPMALLFTGLLFPLSEPVIGNAYQFLAFLILIRAVTLRIKPKMLAIESNMEGRLTRYQQSALFMLLAFSMSCLASLTMHMTAFSPIDNMFRHPVTVSLIYQIALMLLLVGFFSSRLFGKISAVLGVMSSPLIYFILMPYTDLFLLKEGSKLVVNLSFWNETALYGTSILWGYGLLVPAVIFAFVPEDYYGELNRVNLKRIFQRNLLGVVSISALSVMMALLLIKPIADGVFEKISATSDAYFKQEAPADMREFLSFDDISTQKKRDYIESMTKHANVFSDEIRMELYKKSLLSVLLLTTVVYFSARAGHFMSLNMFLRYIRRHYPKYVQRTAVNTLNANRSLTLYFSAFRSISLFMTLSVFVCLCMYLHTVIESVVAPVYEYRNFLIKEHLLLEKNGVAVIPPIKAPTP